jgi:hypothetical protein
MATVKDVITRALKLTGIQSSNEDLDSNDAADALAQLNGIVEKWNVDKLKSYAQADETFTLVPGQAEYTIGPGGDFDSARPVRIEYMFVRDPSGQNLDYKVNSASFDQYKSLRLKTIQSYWPNWFYYNPEFPQGTISFYPTPSKAYTVHITEWLQFGDYTDTSDTVALPTGFNELLVYQLAVEMCSYFRMQCPPKVDQEFERLNMKIDNLVSKDWKEAKYTTTPVSFRGSYGTNRTSIPTPFRN